VVVGRLAEALAEVARHATDGRVARLAERSNPAANIVISGWKS
jgi:hypothetical protein